MVDELLARGETVRVLDDFSTGKRENISGFVSKIEMIEGDLRDRQVAARACADVDYVIHEGAIPSVPRSIADPATTHDVNVTGTVTLLVAARDAQVKRVVLAGSSSAYGDEPALPKEESMRPKPLSPYAASKLAAEHYCRVFFRVYGLETAVVRYFNIFGPRQDPDSQYAAVIPKFIRAMLRDERPTVFGDGTNSRDFTFVANAVRGTLAAAAVSEAAGGLFNVACGGRFTLNQLVEHLNDILGTNIEPEYTERRPGDVPHSMASIERAKSVLGYSPEVDFREGLERTVAWMRDSGVPAQATMTG